MFEVPTPAKTVVSETPLPAWAWKAILLFVMGVTTALGIAWLVAGLVIANPSTSQAGTLTQLASGFFGGVGAFIGLMVGKLS